MAIKFEMDFTFLKDEAGKINGLSLVAQGHTESEVFCRTFPKALVEGSAELHFKESEIIFKHLTCRFPGEYRCEVDPTEMLSFRKFQDEIEASEGKRRMKFIRTATLTAGFAIKEATPEEIANVLSPPTVEKK